MTVFRLILPLLLLVSPSVAGTRVLSAGEQWAAVERGTHSCEALSKALRPAAKGQEQAHVAIAFDRTGPRHGELHARLSRPARAGAQAMLTVGTEQFLLVTRGPDAWSRGPAQEMAIIAALRRATGMRIQAQGDGGRRFTDRYLLAGAPTAIDAAAAACSAPR